MQTAASTPAARRALMQSTVVICVTDSPDKLVTLPAEETAVPMGMHDELATFYGATPGNFTPHASTLDYVIGALGACLAGTFKRALVARGIALQPVDLSTEAVGEIVVDGDVPVIRGVEVRYRLSGTRVEDREKIERAHAVHHRACAVSRSLEAAIEITSTLCLT